MIQFVLSILAVISVHPHPSPEEFKQDLKIEVVKELPAKEKTCQIFLIHHGSTEWSKTGRLQGWYDVPLTESGKEEIYQQAEKMKGVAISAIYSSSLQSARESAEILCEKLKCKKFDVLDEMRGEYHGKFEGYTREQYKDEPHFKFYKSLLPQEEIFFPCGEEGESKADVAKRALPAIRKIAAEHSGENVIIVTHGGVFKLLNFYSGKCSEEKGTVSIPYGNAIQIAADADAIYLLSQK